MSFFILILHDKIVFKKIKSLLTWFWIFSRTSDIGFDRKYHFKKKNSQAFRKY